MIEINNLSKSFVEKQVLENITCSFNKNTINMIIGGSGMGKSVLLKCICGLLLPDSGSVKYHSIDFFEMPKKQQSFLKREIGMLFQAGALFDSKNIEENIQFPLDILSTMTKSEKQKRVDYCLERVGLVGVNKKMPSELSGGMKKRVGIARAIVLKTLKYLFCDEPNSGLDPKTAHKIDRLIWDITKELSITTIIISHDINSVLNIGENIIFLYKGQKEWEGKRENIFETESTHLKEFLSFYPFLKK